MLDDDGVGQGGQHRQRPRALAAQGRHAGRRLARRSRPGRAGADAGPLDQRPYAGRRTVRGAVDEDRPDRVVAAGGRRHRVLTDRPRATPSTSVTRAGTLCARRANGHLYWTYHASGAIKGGPALVGRASCTSATTPVAPTRSAQQRPPGLGGGHQRSAFRLWLGQVLRHPGGRLRTRVHGQHRRARVLLRRPQRRLAWATGTGAYVYASAAVADPPGLGPTVYVGSYDGNMYAFNAQSGRDPLAHPAGGKISGSRRCSETSSTTPTWAPRPRPVSTPSPAVRCSRSPTAPSRRSIADDQRDLSDGYNTIYQMLRRPVPRAASAPASATKRRAAGTRSRPDAHARRSAQAKKARAQARKYQLTRNGRSGAACYHNGLCVVVVEVIVSIRPRRAAGSARSTRRSSIACAKSSRMPQPPASVGAGPSVRRHAAVPAVTSLAFRPPRTAIRALRLVTSKRPPNRGRLAVGSPTKLHLRPSGRGFRGPQRLCASSAPSAVVAHRRGVQ